MEGKETTMPPRKIKRGTWQGKAVRRLPKQGSAKKKKRIMMVTRKRGEGGQENSEKGVPAEIQRKLCAASKREEIT